MPRPSAPRTCAAPRSRWSATATRSATSTRPSVASRTPSRTASEQALADEGADAWVERSRTLAQEVLDRLSRERGHRFDRVGAMHYGYRVDEVDLVADKLARYLETGESLTVEQVRTVAFRMKRGGYREDQVDAVLDAMVEVLLAVG